jgi:hypothetical protein
MNETTGGLSAVPDDTETSIPVKATSGKVGKYNFPATSGDTQLTSSILQQMEELYQKKLQEGRGLLSGLKDAAALSMAARPGGSSAYLQQREQQKADRAAELFNIRSQMAQYEAAQEAQKRFEADKAGLLGGPGAPAAGGAAAPSRVGGIELSDEEKLALGRARTRAEFDKLLNSFVTERLKARVQPSAQESKYEVRYYDENGNVVFDTVDLATKDSLRRQGRLIDVSAPAKPPAAAKPAPAPVTPPPAATPPAQTAPAPAAPATAPAAPQAKKTSGNYLFEDIDPTMLSSIENWMKSRDKDFNMAYATSPSAQERFNSMPLDRRQAFFKAAADITPQAQKVSAELPKPIEAPEAKEPTAEPVQVAQATGRIPTMPELRAKTEVEKEMRMGEAKKEAEQFQQFLTATDAPVAADRASTAQEVIDITMRNPTVVGVLQKPGVGPAIAELFMTGISAPGGHSIGMKQLDEVLFRAYPGTTPRDIEDRDRLRTLLEKTAFHLSNIIKGQGQVTEFERVLLQQVAGSVRSAPENLVKIQQGLLERAKLDQKLGDLYGRMGLPYGQFKQTKEYKAAVKEYENSLKLIRDSKIQLPKTAATPGARTTPQPFTDPAKEKAYQEWKRKQMQKGNK